MVILVFHACGNSNQHATCEICNYKGVLCSQRYDSLSVAQVKYYMINGPAGSIKV